MQNKQQILYDYINFLKAVKINYSVSHNSQEKYIKEIKSIFTTPRLFSLAFKVMTIHSESK